MIGTIRKHSTILWVIVIGVVIITFVFWGAAPGPSNRSGNPNANFYGAIAGEPVKLEDRNSAARESMLGYFLSYGDFPDENARRMGFDLDREAYIRLFMIRKLKAMDIHVSDATVMEKAGEIMRMFGRSNQGGPGAPVPFETFEKNVLTPHGLTAADFENYIRHELGRVQLQNTVAASGRLVTPQEARVHYEREHEEVATEAVFFNASNYLAKVTVSADAVKSFFTNRMAAYRLPDRVQVKYVEFEISNHLAAAEAELVKTNFTELIEADYIRLGGTNYYKEAKSVEEAKGLVRRDLIKRHALNFANRDVDGFLRQLEATKATKPEDFEKVAADMKVPVKVTVPFDSTEGPTNMVVMANFVKEAFSRTPDEPFAGPLYGRDGVYVISFYKQIPSEVPSFDSVRDVVTRDYKFSQATMAAQKAGAEFAKTLTNGLAAGKKFTALCVEAGYKPVPLPPISLSSRTNAVLDDSALYQFKQAAFTAKPGTASPWVPTAEGGFVVFVREKLPLNTTQLNKDLPEYVNRVRMMRQNEAYNAWFRRAAEQDTGFRGIMESLAKRDQQRPGMGR